VKQAFHSRILSGGGQSGSADARFERTISQNGPALRASAPSHSLHPMPSRITRNSHRPRASDRTMVASEATSSLADLSNSMASSPSAEKLTRMDNKPNFSREVKLQWAGSRDRNLASGRGGAFFLTSLFIERFERQSAILSVMGIFRQLTGWYVRRSHRIPKNQRRA
jgi:hypothetical protein